MSIHPQIKFAVLPYEEFVRIKEELEDYEDLRTLREEKAVSGGEPARPLRDILSEIGES